MAVYSKQIFVPAGAPEDMPIITTFTIRENAINRIDVMVDTVATKGLVGIKISIGTPVKKVWNFPADGTDYIRKSETVTYSKPIVLSDYNLPATIICSAPTTVRNHTVMVSIHTESVLNQTSG
jgi:HD-like signal output (HDOD) protein